MNTELSIELATNNDFAAVAAIYNEYIDLGGSTMQETHYTAQGIQGWVEKFSDREKLYVLKNSSETIAWGIIKRYSDREGYRFACETAIYITQSELRKGHGSRMKKFIIEQCKAMGDHHLIAKIFATNTASIEYNLKLGYTIVGRQNEIGFRDGKWLDIVIMQYLIN